MIICALRSIANDYLFSIYFRHDLERTGRTDRDDQRAVGAYVYQDHANLLEELFLGTSVGGEPGLLRERV